MDYQDAFTSVEPVLTFDPDNENCWSETILSAEVTSGTTAPKKPLAIELDEKGVFSFVADSVDHIGDHIISITAIDGSLSLANSTLVYEVEIKSTNPFIMTEEACLDLSQLYLIEKENEQAAALPEEAIEITVGQGTLQIGVPSIAIASLTSVEDVNTLCAPVNETLIVQDENGDTLTDQTIALHLATS